MRARTFVLALLAIMAGSAFAQIDKAVNFGKATVSTGYDASATSIVLTSGHGSRFPNPATWGPFYLVWYNATDYADPSDDPNREIVRVTSNSGDVLGVSRGQDGTVASTKNASAKTYKMSLALTAGVINSMIDTLRAAKNAYSHNLLDWDTTGRSNHEIPVWNSASRKYEHEASPYFNVSANHYGRSNSAGDSVIDGNIRDSSGVTVVDGVLKINGSLDVSNFGEDSTTTGHLGKKSAAGNFVDGPMYVDASTDTAATRAYARSQGGGGSFSGDATKIQGDSVKTTGRTGGSTRYTAIVHDGDSSKHQYATVYTIGDTTGWSTADPSTNVVAIDSGQVVKVAVVAFDSSGANNTKKIVSYDQSVGRFIVGGNAGSASFSTTDTRLAIYVPGATSGDIFVVSPSGADAAPSANDVLRCYAKTDSVVVNRLASGTSGLTVNYIRVK